MRRRSRLIIAPYMLHQRYLSLPLIGPDLFPRSPALRLRPRDKHLHHNFQQLHRWPHPRSSGCDGYHYWTIEKSGNKGQITMQSVLTCIARLASFNRQLHRLHLWPWPRSLRNHSPPRRQQPLVRGQRPRHRRRQSRRRPARRQRLSWR